MKKVAIFFAIIIVTIALLKDTHIVKNSPFLSKIFKPLQQTTIIPEITPPEKSTGMYDESVITTVIDDALPSVVTIAVTTTAREIDPTDPFSLFRRTPTSTQRVERNIGSGFIVAQDGLIITNKHVVSSSDLEYKVVTNDKKKYNVEKIYRDPLNDLAILKINASGLKPLALADSSKLKLGQLAIAIGTPLGEFQNTVTVGIVSGLGRGITAGSPFEGFVEKLDNVIQTDAAISAGNSGGPLLNSAGHVIGINTAVAAQGQNIGFAIPSNVVRELLENFQKQGGTFERPYIGVRYQIVDRETAELNEIVEGAYVQSVVKDSPADKAGIQEEDVIIEFDGQKVQGADDESLAQMILEKKIGDRISLKIWRNGTERTMNLTLEGFSQ